MVPQGGRRLACSAPCAMETRVQVAGWPTVDPGHDGPSALVSQARPCLALAVWSLSTGQRRVACGGVAPAQARRFRDGPLESGGAELRPRRAIARAGRCRGVRDHAAIGHNLLPPRDAREVRPRSQEPAPAARA